MAGRLVMPKQPPPAAPVLEVGDPCIAVYPGGRRHRARITGKVGNHLIICHLNAAGDLVTDPDGTTRLFTADDLRSVAGRPGGLGPVATLEPETKGKDDRNAA
jgi:hypothetical protein